MRWFESLFLDLFFPRRCACCGREGNWACASCASGLMARVSIRERRFKDGFQAVSILEFRERLVRELLHYLKYDGTWEAAGVLAGLHYRMVPVLAGWLPEDAVLVPVPTTKAKLRGRGYNQAEELARAFGELLGVPVTAGLLERGGNRRSQVGKGREDRAAQVEGVFGVNARAAAELAGRPLVVVDDLMTTGSTIRACGKALREAGFSVSGLTLAREG